MTIFDAQADWRVLDGADFIVPNGIRLISHEYYDDVYTEGLVQVEEIKQGWLSRLFSFCNTLSNLIWAFNILFAADKRTVIIANGSTQFGNYICLLNYYLFFKKKTILFWDSHIEPKSAIKKYLARRCFLGCNLATLWSKRQPRTYAQHFNLPEDLFIFIPYKATHSKTEHRTLPTLNYIFAGGNTRRDYKTLSEAVRGTNVTLIISTSRMSIINSIQETSNIIPLTAVEPSYSKLMAASRFVIVPMLPTGIRGAGETNYCNSMWHGKAVITMDDMSAEDYVVEGETGYIVPHGDVALLQKRILHLWNNREKAEQMGAKGQQLAHKYFTQVQGIRRLVKLACLVGQEAFINK